MKIEIVVSFNDMTKPEADRFTEAGTTTTVSAERGAELIGIGIAKAVDEAASSPAKPVAAGK